MIEVVLQISGMSCPHCRQAVEKALSAVPGVQSVNVHLDQSLARVSVADSVACSALVDAVQHAGFSVLDI
ncbi:MAG: cation transporter [Bacillota bacterium]|nr:cation transporter [Bacillota bacterium]